ncbi:kinesin-like protein [Kipferlia bialata]|uniref:Kinesin-like protein n=1 Tax=Kipferlia bialata TaxID=797122 RepID=A0A9K3CQB1_9EUKA|nr:kinesin-like protein [Kipferlia bialata]|eukprot:g1267.t1
MAGDQAIRVAVRVRPLSKSEGTENAWQIEKNSIFMLNPKTQKAQPDAVFQYDCCYGPETPTAEVYRRSAQSVLDSTLDGMNGTLFAYGQTSSGKTHSMSGSAKEPGLTPLLVNDLFDRIQQDCDTNYHVRVSYLEIYNEELKDLLSNATPHIRQSMTFCPMPPPHQTEHVYTI